MSSSITQNPDCSCAMPQRRSICTAAVAAAWVPRAGAQATLSPDAALAALMEGNRRFVDRAMTSPAEDLAVLKQNTAEKQEPFAAVLACADSRVPVELLFDQSIGRVFVARVAGNVASDEIIASLEFGAAVLGIKVILVLGHSDCGAVKAAIADQPAPGRISSLYPYIRPAVERAGPDPGATSRANAVHQAMLLASTSPVIAGLRAKGEIAVEAGYYDVATGVVSLLR